MKETVIILISIIFSLFAFAQVDTVKSENLEMITVGNDYENAKLYKTGDTLPFTGVMVDYFYGTDIVELAVEINYNKSQNQVRTYYPSGHLKEEWYNNSKGLEQGKYTAWYENGDIEITGFHKNGYNHGIWNSYFENGERMYEREYDEGKKVGTWTTWNSIGDIIKEEFFEETKSIETK